MFTGVATLQVSERSETPDVVISAGLWWTSCKISHQIERVASCYSENSFRKL